MEIEPATPPADEQGRVAVATEQPHDGVRPARLAVVCCDGVPASGLLTVLRNVLDIGVTDGLLHTPVVADLGFSWRPDKPRFFPTGPAAQPYPDWLHVVGRAVPDPGPHGRRLTAVRDQVAVADALDPARRAALDAEIDQLARPYEAHFTELFDAADVDWVCAINMTLSDAVPVTLALHRAARARWGGGRPGGLLHWDHDLFGSCAVVENGARVYPQRPNDLTPLPGADPFHRWVVITDALAREAADYPTPLRPVVAPNPLPARTPARQTPRHRAFLRDHGIAADRPILLVPVRVSRPKGAHLAVALLDGVRAAVPPGEPMPCLLVFGSLDEEPDYATELRAAVADRGLHDDVRLLDGVPLASASDAAGRWRLDESDLLALAGATGGAVVFTPSSPDVESVGLGPALAAVAGVPCAVTPYHAFADVYGDQFAVVPVAADDPAASGPALLAAMRANRRDDPDARRDRERNRRIVADRFPVGPWRAVLEELAIKAGAPAGRETS
ncbi:hypothetical protein [Micromonospora sp. DT233]|uniref:hypothetical protein n=1 Tax=Micromonospora sp. DT233 TaxID=3393432 RepID=UPI003CEAB250